MAPYAAQVIGCLAFTHPQQMTDLLQVVTGSPSWHMANLHQAEKIFGKSSVNFKMKLVGCDNTFKAAILDQQGSTKGADRSTLPIIVGHNTIVVLGRHDGGSHQLRPSSEGKEHCHHVGINGHDIKLLPALLSSGGSRTHLKGKLTRKHRQHQDVKDIRSGHHNKKEL